MHWDKTILFKKFPSDKVNGTKNALFFIREHQLITVLLLICDSYMSWGTRFASLKLRVVFSIFDSVSFLLKFVFVQQNAWTLWLQKIIIPFKIKIIEKPHTFLLLDLWFLSCNMKFYNSMISATVGAPQKLTWWQIF